MGVTLLVCSFGYMANRASTFSFSCITLWGDHCSNFTYGIRVTPLCYACLSAHYTACCFGCCSAYSYAHCYAHMSIVRLIALQQWEIGPLHSL